MQQKRKKRRNACARMVLPLIACQTATASSIPSILLALLSLSPLLFPLTVSSLSIFHRYFRATHLATRSTPTRKRGVRNVIAPLRGVSWLSSSSFLFLTLSFSSRPTMYVRKRHRTKCVTRRVCNAYLFRIQANAIVGISLVGSFFSYEHVFTNNRYELATLTKRLNFWRAKRNVKNLAKKWWLFVFPNAIIDTR